MKLTQLFRYLHTIAYLTPRQVAYQLIRRFSLRKILPQVTGQVRLRSDLSMIRPLHRRMQEEENTFTFLNLTKRFDLAQFDWASSDMGKLWRYNLHYFDYLNEEGRSWQSKAFLIESWIKNNPQGVPDAWDPFPVSLRIVNWIKLFLTPEAAGKLEEL